MDREAEFLDRVDFAFPYADCDAMRRLLDQAGDISHNCVMALVLEVVRPPRGERPDVRLMSDFLDLVEAKIRGTDMVPVVVAARDWIQGRGLTSRRAHALLDALEAMRGQYAALSIITHIVEDDGLDDIDAREDRIRDRWKGDDRA